MKVTKSPFLIKPHSKVRLSHIPTDEHLGVADKAAAAILLAKHRNKLSELQEVLFASQSRSLLIVLQGMDTAGKDGTVRHIFSGVNPAGCDVASFKVPTPLEARHDFLWRCEAQVPPRGMMGIFNRSHYEQVLSPRVHGLVSDKVARRQMDQINAWEETLADNGVVILKFFLHISREEQTRRLQARIDAPDKRWKLSPADFAERQYWPQYADAYEDILSRTSHKHAPWFVIPADHKWYRDVPISELLVRTLESLDLQYPKPAFDPKGLQLDKQKPQAVAKKVAAASKATSQTGDATDKA